MTTARRWLLPREHGAYMELSFPLLSAWLLGAPRAASFLLGAAAVMVFLAHEAFLVLLGRRGARRAREEQRTARAHLAVLGLAALVTGGAGLALASPLSRWLALVPAAIGAVSLSLAAAGRERSAAGELQIAVGLSSLALPVAVAADVPWPRAAALCAVWAVCFGVGTVAARGLVFRKRDGGRMLRAATAAAVVVLGGGVALAASGLLPVALALAPTPFVLLVGGLALRPPSPKHMTRVGFALTGASATTLACLLTVP